MTTLSILISTPRNKGVNVLPTTWSLGTDIPVQIAGVVDLGTGRLVDGVDVEAQLLAEDGTVMASCDMAQPSPGGPYIGNLADPDLVAGEFYSLRVTATHNSHTAVAEWAAVAI